ncbi:MAG: ADP-ribosylation factor-like protein [Promethearchaeota archaeon]
MEFGADGVCPECGARLERFEFFVTVVEEGKQVFSHPDPIKRKEAEMSALFQSWSVRSEEVEDSESEAVPVEHPPLADIGEWDRIQLELPPLREGAYFTPDVFSLDIRERAELQMGFLVSEPVKKFGARVVQAGKILIEQHDNVKYVGSPVGRGAIVLMANPWEEDKVLRENVAKTANALRLVIDQEMTFEDFQDMLTEVFELPIRPTLEAFPEELREPPVGVVTSVFIIDARDEIVVEKHFWKMKVNVKEVQNFAYRIKEAQDTLIEVIGPIKYMGTPLGRGVVVLVADVGFDDYTLREKLDRVTYEFRRVISYEAEYEDFMAKLEDYIVSPFKVIILGYDGVGKTTLKRLLSGLSPTHTPIRPVSFPGLGGGPYYPEGTKRADTDFAIRSSGPYEITVWDWSGQDRFRRLWELFLRGSHIMLLVTDSTLQNVLNSKNIIDLIRRKDIKPQLLAIANKQDLPGALSPQLVERILGIKTYGMVAIDPDNREKGLDIIKEVLKRGRRKDDGDDEGLGGITPRFPPPPSPAP